MVQTQVSRNGDPTRGEPPEAGPHSLRHERASHAPDTFSKKLMKGTIQ